ncbi:hypothetical protein [Psychrosphaera algicola]|uniref:TonB-dependent receptor-like beta-barrel domain-containing protein n=1 Tax=Psychrosphaera algicola TaxID=3023714 RepID=A0ABT5FHS8_9GAMM|nr:hypothetical protein [Psychrosphaera sp. G1-22]MDC2890753.1 hypothetical protein [Psychrosphaera sp. G1-22]
MLNRHIHSYRQEYGQQPCFTITTTNSQPELMRAIVKSTLVTKLLSVMNNKPSSQKNLLSTTRLSWQFTEELQGIFSVNNLTDEPNRSYFGSQAATGTLQYFGRQFYVGLNAKF